MNVRVRSLNSSGCSVFLSWLNGPSGPPPREVLTGTATSEALDAEYWVNPDVVLATSFEVGEYLHKEVLKDVEDRHSLLASPGIWAWLSLVLIDNLISRGGKNKGRPLAAPHYIDTGPRLVYRLIARTAWDLVGVHGAAARVALGSKTTPWGEMAEQMTSSQEVYAHPSVWPVACQLYLDEEGSVRRGATTQRDKRARRDPKSQAGLGGVRRLPRTFKQFDRTYNMRFMPVSEIVALLPAEYQRWKS